MYRMMIVDDEPMIRKGLEKMIRQLEPLITSIRTAENGEEALELIHEERPHFVLTDIRMPKMDGLELCRRLSDTEYGILVVVISGYGDFEYAQRCVSYGVKEYLLKPVSKSAVKAMLEKLIALAGKLAFVPEFVSVAKLSEWVERLEAAIWQTQQDDLEQLIAEWKLQYDQYMLRDEQKQILIAELYELLMKKLLARDVQVFHTELHMPESADAEASFRLFQHALESIQQELRARRRGKAKDPVEEAKAYIEANLEKEVSLEEVAGLLGLNASYFSQLFKHATGETFSHYRIKRRMEKAKKLLEQPHYRITDISYEVGYADHPHFTKTFKKYTGFSPSEYRSRLGIE